ncbi:MAG: TolC family protein [Thermoanaerobaculaceae bacterium]|nr:TolC family protein [Thermoanaerobaculaceae bacterium]MDI9622302.1 TolC family protein [Acidobacteriota bacterium]NLH10622.1 TolC family protein [Holophagae bacterium]HPW55057.1 TolC family protein [Thermoanaerobaculaceae bacterium]
MRQVLLVGMAILSVGRLVAAEPLSLRTALELARQGAGEALAGRERAQAAAERVRQARGFQLPSVSLQEIFTRTDSPAEAFALKLNQERFSFADFMTSDPNRPDPLDTAITRVEATIPLFTGGELSGRIAQAELAAQAADRQARWAAEQAALAAGEAYVMVEQAREYVALLEKARETVAAHVALAEAYAEQGMLVRSELLRAQVELSRLDDLVTEARGRTRVAEANLAFRLGQAQGSQWELEPLPPPAAVTDTFEAWAAAADSRLDLLAARDLLSAGEREERVRKAAYLPKVGMVARADWVDDTLFGTHGSSTAIMAVASINLFAGGSDRAAVAAARHEARAGREDVKRFAEGVRLEVRQTYEEAVTARQRHATARQALAAAREAERITGERFRSGVVKMLDLLDVATARRESETRELVARAEAQLALMRLAVRAGRTADSVLPD